MQITPHEKLLGIETMRTRIESFHQDRLQRIGKGDYAEMVSHFRTAAWSKAKVLKEYRAIPEGMEIETRGNSSECYDPTNPPRRLTDEQMAEVIRNSRSAILLG